MMVAATNVVVCNTVIGVFKMLMHALEASVQRLSKVSNVPPPTGQHYGLGLSGCRPAAHK
jgi:hypothetical protein